MFGSDVTTLIISNEKMNEIAKTRVLIKGVGKIIQNESKEQKREFLGMLWGFLVATLLGNLLTDKDTFRASECTIRVGHDFQWRLIP